MNDVRIINGGVQLAPQPAPVLQQVKLLKPQVVAGSVRIQDEIVSVVAELAELWIAANEAVAVETTVVLETSNAAPAVIEESEE